MENRVNFYEGMDVDPADHNTLQQYAQESLDHVVADAVTTSQRYAGFTVTKTGITSVSVDPGRLYSGGKRYAKTIATAQDFITSLPLAGKKIVSVVVWGAEQDTGVTPREFLLNEETGASEPKPVAMTKARIANVQFAQGTEAPDPTPPIVDVGYTRIANITLSTTGVDKIEMLVDTQVENLDTIGDRTEGLEAFKAEAGPKISTLSSDLAKLSNQLRSTASSTMIERVLMRLSVLEFTAKIPANAVDSQADYFLSHEFSDLTHPNSNCKVEEGIRFPDGAADDKQLQIFDPLTPKVKIVNGIMLPAYDRELWLKSGEYQGEVQVASYSYQAYTMVQKTMTRQRTRYGAEFTVCSNSAFWNSGIYDYFTRTFRRGNEVFEAVEMYSVADNILNYDAAGNPINHSLLRLRQIWVDNVAEPYWDKVTIDHNVNGAQIAESFLQGQNMWLDAIGLYFTRLANDGNVTINLVEVNSFGLPMLDSTISHTVLTRDKMALYPLETVVPIEPVYLQAGKRYAIVVTTAADHWVATVPGESFTQGTFFYVLDGAYAQGDGTKDLMFKLYRAKFRQNRTVIELNSLSLAGGLLSIDINADTVSPAGTTVTYEIQPSGSGQWYNLLDVNAYILGQGGSIPVLCGFRAVLNGSVDMMPAVKLTGSSVHISRPATSRTHITATRTLPATSQTIHVIQRFEGWDAVHHTAAVKLRTGSGYNTLVTPTSFTDVAGIDEFGQNWIERHYVFALATAVNSYKIQSEGTTDSAQITYHVAWRKDYAL